MKISVIIPTYNRERYIVEALESVMNQTRPPDQIIVVNDGSTDGTANILRPFQDRITHLYQENAGKPVALNRALSEASGDAVWIFDDDDVALPGALEALESALEANPEAGFSFGAYHWAHEDATGRLVQGAKCSIPDCSPAELLPYLTEGCCFKHTATLVRKSCYDAVGSFDPAQARSEDYDMQLRLCRAFDGVAIDDPILLFRVHAGDRGGAAARHSATERDSIHLQYDRMVFEKLYSAMPLEAYLPRDRPAGELKPQELRQAYLQRACAMARRAIWDKALEDIGLAAQACPAPLGAREREICFNTFSEAVALREAPGHAYFRRVRQALIHGRAHEIRRMLSRGLFWSVRTEAASKGFAPAVRNLNYLLSLLGVRGLVPFFAGFAVKPVASRSGEML